jgi:hypothetical protein
MNQPNKTSTSEPIAVYYDPQLGNGRLYVWPSPISGYSLKFSVQQYIEDFDAASNEPYFPVEWLEALVYNLAVRLCPKYEVRGEELQMLRVQAAEYLADAEHGDAEHGSLYLSPESYY